MGVTGSCLVNRSYWKFSGHGELLKVFWSMGVTGSFLVWNWELLEVVWSFGVTGSCLDIGSYWELSCDWELLEVVWSFGVTGSCLDIGSYWKFSGQ